MQSRQPSRAATVTLAIAAALSLAFAPSVESEPDPDPASSNEAGECLKGYAYVTVNSSPYGITSTWCVKQTDCGSYFQVGPAHAGHGPVIAHYYVSVPTPTASNVICHV